MGWLVLLPVILIGSAASASFAFVRLSSMRISSEGVEIRNYPQAARMIPLAEADHFAPTKKVGAFQFLRPTTAVLVLTDGTRIPTRVIGEPEAGYGIEALNDRLAALRPSA